MARWQDAPFIGGAYQDDTRPFSVQDAVNQLVVPAEKSGTRSGAKQRACPGMTPFCDLGTGKPIRGMHNVEGRFFVVSGSSLFQVSPTGVATNLGTIPGVTRVSMAHNQVAGGNQLVIGTGQSGFVYDTTTETLAPITDDAFNGAKAFDYVDSYIVGIDPTGNFAFTSDLADAFSYSSIDRYVAEGSPDLIVGTIVTHREWWLAGERTIEPYINNPVVDSAGIVTTTFQRTQGVVIERGIASTFCMALIDNTVMFLGNDGIVYKMNGYTPIRVSTHAIEDEIASSNWKLAFAMVMESRGHKVYYLTLPDGHTWGFDCATNEWHRRESYGLKRWRANALEPFGQDVIVGDYTNGQLYKLDWAAMHENGQPLIRRRVGPVYADAQNRITLAGFELVVDTGSPYAGLPPAQAGRAYTLDLRCSKDGGYSWSSWRRIPLGTTGDFAKRLSQRGWGMSEQFVMECRVTDPIRADLLAASMLTEPMDS